MAARISMPSRKHQRLVVLLTEHPLLFVELVRLCSEIEAPGELELLPGPEKVTLPTSDRIADGAVVVRRREGHRVPEAPALDGTANENPHHEAFVLEVQLHKDEEKRRSWPSYVVSTAERLRCPATLLVVAASEGVARWAATPIDIGRGRMMLTPLVVGPSQIPADVSLEEARTRPDRLALSVIIHGHRRGSLRLNRTAMRVARELVARGDRKSIVLADLIVDSVRADVRRMVQAEMQAETGWGKTLWFSEIGKAVADGWAEGRLKGQLEGRLEGKAEGRLEGKAEALWMVLHARRIEPTQEQRTRIEACRDPRQLEQWLERALVAGDAAEVFAR